MYNVLQSKVGNPRSVHELLHMNVSDERLEANLCRCMVLHSTGTKGKVNWVKWITTISRRSIKLGDHHTTTSYCGSTVLQLLVTVDTCTRGVGMDREENHM